MKSYISLIWGKKFFSWVPRSRFFDRRDLDDRDFCPIWTQHNQNFLAERERFHYFFRHYRKLCPVSGITFLRMNRTKLFGRSKYVFPPTGLTFAHMWTGFKPTLFLYQRTGFDNKVATVFRWMTNTDVHWLFSLTLVVPCHFLQSLSPWPFTSTSGKRALIVFFLTETSSLGDFISRSSR
jgi:hypothetical protein